MSSTIGGISRINESHTAAKRREAAEKAIRERSKERKIEAVHDAAVEAYTRYREQIQKVLSKIEAETESELQALSLRFQGQDSSFNDSNIFVTGLFRANAGIFNKYHVFDEEDNQDGSASIGIISTSNAAEERPATQIDPESDDDKDSLNDRDDDDGSETGAFSQVDDFYSQNYNARSGIAAIPGTARNSQRRPSRKIVLESDDEEAEGNIGKKLPSPHHNKRNSLRDHLYRRLRPTHSTVGTRGSSSSPAKKDTKKRCFKRNMSSFRQRLPYRRTASQPIPVPRRVGSSISSPGLRPVSPAASQGSQGARRQPFRRSASAVRTYNDKKVFRSLVGKLDGPEYWLA